ncbi:nucleotide sugar dehydrogenase [Candidatus Bathyarchaeota archaeon]|nr:nucleotide sugar dehydrogenase [Candidatus Bathyarchaeota archaeon]
MNKKVVVLGVGYVGLPLAITLAKVGYKVIGVDVNKKIVKAINDGSLPIKEKNIENFFIDKKVKENFTVNEKPDYADVFIVCVQTPIDQVSKMPDLSHTISAIESIAPFLKKGNLVILESTLPPFTCRRIIKPLIESRTKLKVGKDVFLAHCPERVMPGETFYELIHNNRVIGGINSKSAHLAREIYASFVKGDIDLTDDVTAEMVKLMENTYRDVNIALANEFSLVADTHHIDIKKAIEFANKHPRVKILNPGIGVGGHCLPKDPWFLIHSDPKNASLILTARKVNELMPEKVAAKIRRILKNIKNPKIVALGLTYKPDSDDLRESPSLEVITLLKEDGYNVVSYDNFVKGHKYRSIANIAKGADCLAVLVEHTAIREELEKYEAKIKSLMRTPIILRIGTSYKPDFFDIKKDEK